MGAPKQKWTAEEEAALRAGVEKYGPGKWRAIQKDSKFGPCLTSRSNVDLKIEFVKMMKYDSPTVQRSITPSPLHVTPAWSREQLCDLYPTDLYSTRPPRFLLDALEGVSDTSVPIELPKHFLPNFPFRVVNGRPDPTVAEMREIISYFPGCTGVAYAPPYLVVKWPRAQMKPWPLTVRGMPLYYATPDRPFPPTYGKGGRSPQIMKGIHERLKPWESPSNNLIEGIARMLVEKGIGLSYLAGAV